MAKAKKKPSANPPDANVTADKTDASGSIPNKADGSKPASTKVQEPIDTAACPADALRAHLSQIFAAIKRDPKAMERVSLDVSHIVRDTHDQIAAELNFAVKAINLCAQLELKRAQDDVKRILAVCQRQIETQFTSVLHESGKPNIVTPFSPIARTILKDAATQVQASLKSATTILEKRTDFELRQAYDKIQARLTAGQHQIDPHLISIVRSQSGKLDMSKQAAEQIAKVLRQDREDTAAARAAASSKKASSDASDRPLDGCSEESMAQKPKESVEAAPKKHSHDKAWIDASLKTLETVSAMAQGFTAATKPPPKLPWAESAQAAQQKVAAVPAQTE